MSFDNIANATGRTAAEVHSPTTDSRKGYAYTDVYGFAHVVREYETALQNAGDGNVYAFEGRYGGGYALDNQGDRAALPLPGAVAYGNDVKNGIIPETSEGVFVLLGKLSADYQLSRNVRIPDVELLDREANLLSRKKLSEAYL